MRIESEKDCGACYFLGEVYSPTEPVCDRTGSLIKDTKVCLSGVLYQAPKTAEDLRKIIKATEDKWRSEGEGT